MRGVHHEEYVWKLWPFEDVLPDQRPVLDKNHGTVWKGQIRFEGQVH